ncbi:MAG: DUF4855 domain-containing protein [Clostridia bacterium]|nr:DUF4855 domain-containing protein [Clostridia bacterium]
MKRFERGLRILSLLLLTAAVLSSVLPSVSAAGDGFPFPLPEQLDGIHNISLTYTFAPHAANYARHTKDSLLHDVGYFSTDGTLTDTFMDAYLFLPCVCAGPSGGTMYESSNPARASDWKAYLDDLFLDGYNVSALNSAAAEVGERLGMPDYRVRIFFTALFPHEGQTNFGSLDGKRDLNFGNPEDRAAAVDWLIAEEKRRFEEGGYSHLELVGYYWFEEFITYYSESDLSLVRHFNAEVHDLGLKSIWIPYYRASGYNHCKEYGFDVVCMQPNLMWMSDYDKTRVESCVSDCRTYGMSMEMEMDNDVLTTKYNRFLSYLRGGVSSGINRSVNMYYQNSCYDVLYYAKNSTDPRGRSVYDLTYRYAKGLLTMEEIPKDVPLFSFPNGYEWIQDGKSYVASGAYTGDGTLVYQDVDGKELTDGIFASRVWSTDFHAFHRSLQEPGGGYRITVDLGDLESRIGAFLLEFGLEEASGIGLPDAPVISVSTDGETWRTLGTMSMDVPKNGITHARLIAGPARARYVRADFGRGNCPFVFCSEFMIGKKILTGPIPKGDVNEDRVVNSLDYLLVRRYVLKNVLLTADERKRADVDGNGAVNAKDYQWVKRYVLKLID